VIQITVGEESPTIHPESAEKDRGLPNLQLATESYASSLLHAFPHRLLADGCLLHLRGPLLRHDGPFLHGAGEVNNRLSDLKTDVELAKISPELKVVDSLSSTVPEVKLAGDTARKELAAAPAPKRPLRVGRLFTCTTPECQ
jgi:hypothetical protein